MSQRQDLVRHIAFMVRIGELLEAHLVRGGEQSPTGFYLPKRKLRVFRANLMGFVIGIDKSTQGYEEFVLDDGTGQIPVRNFDSTLQLDKLDVGDIVNVIGRVREYNDVRYVIPEVVRKLNDKRFLELRELEIKTTKTPECDAVVETTEEVSEVFDETSPKQIVYEMIREYDKGDGVEIQELYEKSKLRDIDGIIDTLIKEGEIFKISPTRVKVL
ncbi:hypothetical protein DRJ48_01655 [Candidatus Woesearchaeota archaeon]|nr:hypothetical protein [Candidatus Woesearchaeota archaeon]RLE43152.1 MAG: hypothetical protein DRJ48_01655 [Candidatus Woesearchaeota archaeon]